MKSSYKLLGDYISPGCDSSQPFMFYEVNNEFKAELKDKINTIIKSASKKIVL